MLVAIASGKGGTGKTTVSASLASVWSEVWNRPVAAVDLDVEEPNLHLFLRPCITRARTASLEIPEIDTALCTRCGACRELCQFGAVTILGDTPMVFADMCHACGGCRAVCPVGAVSAGQREIGRVEEGTFGDNVFLRGLLRVGEAMSPPLIRDVMTRLAAMLAEQPELARADAILDAPPGTSCPAGAAVAQADCIVLVTEPTPFGVHDFRLAVEAFTTLGKPMAVVVNRAGTGDDTLYAACRDLGLSILAEFPDDRAVAETYARGGLLADVGPQWRQACLDLAKAVGKLGGERRHA